MTNFKRLPLIERKEKFFELLKEETPRHGTIHTKKHVQKCIASVANKSQMNLYSELSNNIQGDEMNVYEIRAIIESLFRNK